MYQSVRLLSVSGGRGWTIVLRGGEYYLSRPIHLDTSDRGLQVTNYQNEAVNSLTYEPAECRFLLMLPMNSLY
jgi:hypothetical protein